MTTVYRGHSISTVKFRVKNTSTMPSQTQDVSIPIAVEKCNLYMGGVVFKFLSAWVRGFNPVELVCHELKEYIRRKVKPWSKQELIDGIKAFWKTTTAKCQRYLGHLKKVIKCKQEYVRDKSMQPHIRTVNDILQK